MHEVAQLLEKRRGNWHELETIVRAIKCSCSSIQLSEYTRFAALYRAVCVPTGFSGIVSTPLNTVQYLHRLVGRAHNLLYRRRKFDVQRVLDMLFLEVPQRIFNDRCVQTAFVLFLGTIRAFGCVSLFAFCFPAICRRSAHLVGY